MIPLASARGTGRTGRGGGSASSAAQSTGIKIHAPPVNPHTLQLPDFIQAEARFLKAGAGKDNPISEPDARPLVQSTALWLMRMGVINRSEHPGVIDQAGKKLHDILPLDILSGGHSNGGRPTSFGTRINTYLGNHVRNDTGTLAIEVPLDEELNTPMRALDRAGLVARVAEPTQGHSGGSILGKGRQRMPSNPFRNGGRPTDEDEDEDEDDFGGGGGDGDSGDPARPAARPARMPTRAPAPAAGPSAPRGDRSETSAPAPAAGPSAPRGDQSETPAPASAAAGSAPTGNTPADQISIAALLSSLASRAGLDVVVNHAGRGPASPFPFVSTDPGEGGEGGGQGEGEGGSQDEGGGRDEGRGRGRGQDGRGRGKGKGKKKARTTDEAAASAPPAAAATPPSHPPFEQSAGASAFEISSDAALTVGAMVAYPMAIGDRPEEWYVGEVIRISKPHWCDVKFDDGKLWMRTKTDERATAWHVVRKRSAA